MSVRQPLRRGACPGVVDAMAAADGMLLRLRLPGGRIDVGQLRAVADVAERFGNGIVELTGRANLQLRGVHAERLRSAATCLVEAGLSTGDAQADARRALVAPALAGHDPAGGNVDRVGIALTEHLATADVRGVLPAKFSIVLDDGSPLGVSDVDGDLVLRVADAHDIDQFLERVLGDVAMIAAGRPPAARPRPAARGFTGPVVGVHSHLHPDRCNVIAAPAFGRVGVDQIYAAADAADAAHALAVRCTHRRGLAFVGVERERLPAMLDALAATDLSTDASDAVHGVTACAGSPGCASSRADTLTRAAQLVTSRRSSGARALAPAMHFAGCEKLCGAPKGSAHVVAGDRGELDVPA